MIRRIALSLLISCFCFYLTQAQNKPIEVSILFYNVENLFDTVNNPDTEDDAFTPEGDMHWTQKRLHAKLLNISKVILSASGWNPPAVAGLCEVENRQVLDQLIYATPLNNFQYKFIHKESPDHRGIDVALLYRPDVFNPVEYESYSLTDDENSEIKTREILYVKGEMLNDTVHLFVNHWPSRFSGILETYSFRIASAKLLKQKVAELQTKYLNPKIVIMGDFNDNPEDESILSILGAKKLISLFEPHEIYNLMQGHKKVKSGTLKYQSQWYTFDQFMVTGNFFIDCTGISISQTGASIINLPYLLEKDAKFGGLKPFRTYHGFQYNGGFSDHLPVLLNLEIRN